MNGKESSDLGALYDRKLLLSQEKRNQVLELWEVQKYGTDSFSDPDYLCVYGLRPPDWHARGVRILARTAVECTRDRLGDLIGNDIAATVQSATAAARTVILDPFAGSCNTLFWIVRNVPGSSGFGFESDDAVFSISCKNLSLMAANIELVHEDHKTGVKRLSFSPDELIVVYVAPPWGDALREDTGLDLRRTEPPVGHIIDLIESVFDKNKILYAIQVYESVETQSLEELRRRFDWSALRIYDINAPGNNHGILLGTKGWAV